MSEQIVYKEVNLITLKVYEGESCLSILSTRLLSLFNRNFLIKCYVTPNNSILPILPQHHSLYFNPHTIFFHLFVFNLFSWTIASIHSLATPMGSLVSTPIMNAYGRKNTLLLSIMPLLCGWSIIALSTSHLAILVGRVACGIAVGLMAAPSQVRG